MTDLQQQLRALKRLSAKQLCARYTELTGDEICSGNKAGLIKRVAWQLQVRAEGDISQRARRHALELAAQTDIRQTPPPPPPPEAPPPPEVSPEVPPKVAGGTLPGACTRQSLGRHLHDHSHTAVHQTQFAHDPRLPMPGTTLTRIYKGRTIKVTVLPDGFECDGRRFKSLSAVAKTITGSHVSGYAFFQLNNQRSPRSAVG